MRPRHHTAENAIAGDDAGCRVEGFNEAAASHRGKQSAASASFKTQNASMRPRHHTAENLANVVTIGTAKYASMRPRHHTAENKEDRGMSDSSKIASMRPRHHTAENLELRRWRDYRHT